MQQVNSAKSPWSGRSISVLVFLLVACFIVAGIGGLVTTPRIENWYATLNKPWFNPPNWIFGPVWSILYATMAIAAWRVWLTGTDRKSVHRALGLFAIQLLCNLGWSLAFFGAANPLAGLVLIVILELLIVLTIGAFRAQNRLTAWLLVPYAAWVGFAMLLNLAIYRLN